MKAEPLVLILALAPGMAAAQVCEQPTPLARHCTYLQPGPPPIVITARAELRRDSSTRPTSSLALSVDGRICGTARVAWAGRRGFTQVRCASPAAPAAHAVDAQLYGVDGVAIRPGDLSIQVQPLGRLAALPSDPQALGRTLDGRNHPCSLLGVPVPFCR